MPKSLWNERDRKNIRERVERLEPGMRPLWGKMSASRMLAHLNDWMRMIKGELPTAPRAKFLRTPGVKHFIIYWMPFPKGVPTAPELISRDAAAWDEEHAAFCRYLGSFEMLRSTEKWPAHPAFGNISTTAWGVLGYRHTDHHLRQFGV